jgi:predicted Zn-dependent protease
MCNCKPSLTRRNALGLLAAAAAAPALGGCERIAPWVVSQEYIDELGLETWARLLQRMPVSGDDAAHRQVAGIAERLLVAAGEAPERWEVRVFAQADANAFVLPGRKIGVLEGMIRLAGDDGELAAVIGHEIGHLEADHARERMTGEIARQWGLRLIAFLLDVNEVAFAQEIAAMLGIGAEFGLSRPYGRAQELEADRLGLFMMAKAGYDPQDAADLWRRMDGIGDGGPAILSTHPAPQARIEAIEALIPEVLGEAVS